MHTSAQYTAFDTAYRYFNEKLFAGQPLPDLMVTLQRKPHMYGYFSPQTFMRRGAATQKDVEFLHEIGLNPDGFVGRDDRDVLSTLVQEMVHVWQVCFGKPGRRGYHNREWAKKMHEVGLYPSSTGAVGGAELGEHMSHYIIDGGAFALACDELLKSGFRLEWQTRTALTPLVPRTRKNPDLDEEEQDDLDEGDSDEDNLGEDNLGEYEDESLDEADSHHEPADRTCDPDGSSVQDALSRPGAGEADAQASLSMMPGVLPRVVKNDRVRFTCPECGQNAWARPSAVLLCGQCWKNGTGSIETMQASVSG